jgi:hypothetical protein
MLCERTTILMVGAEPTKVYCSPNANSDPHVEGKIMGPHSLDGKREHSPDRFCLIMFVSYLSKLQDFDYARLMMQNNGRK